MVDFQFYNPCRILFGKDNESKLPELIRNLGGSRVLMHYGGGSIKKNGVYDKVTQALKDGGIEFYELGGVQPNPRLKLVREGIALCKEKTWTSFSQLAAAASSTPPRLFRSVFIRMMFGTALSTARLPDQIHPGGRCADHPGGRAKARTLASSQTTKVSSNAVSPANAFTQNLHCSTRNTPTHAKSTDCKRCLRYHGPSV